MINTNLREDKLYRQLLIYSLEGDKIFESDKIEIINKNFLIKNKVRIEESKIIDFDIDDKENLIILACNSHLKSGIFRRELAQEDIGTSQDEITIAISGINAFNFKDAIAMFEALNLNTKIVLLERGDLSHKQFMQVINTEIMVGKGSDLFYSQFPYNPIFRSGKI